MYKEIHIKELRVTTNLNGINTRINMVNRAPHMEMGTKVINSFKSENHRIAGEVLDYTGTLILQPIKLTSVKEIKLYIQEHKQNCRIWRI